MDENPTIRLEVLLSTMRLQHWSIANDMNISCDCLIINQADDDKSEEHQLNNRRVKIISVKEKGLSNSRNMALEQAAGDICLFADDDVKYVPDFEQIILAAYEKLPEADLVIFNYESTATWRQKKSLGNSVKKLGYLDCLKVSSVMISFRRSSILERGIRFNPLFGAGGEFQSGEDNIFLFDCLRKGLTIYYYPQTILKVEFNQSSWFRGFGEKYFRNKGALAYMLFKNYYFLFIVQFALRKYGLYRNQMGMWNAVKYMLSGQRYCARLIRNGHAES